MKASSSKITPNKESVPESEEQKYKQKCIELKKRITEVEENNKIATLALSRTKLAIRRMRLEYVVLLERLEDRAIAIPDGNEDTEQISPPPSPSRFDESIESKSIKSSSNRRGTKRLKGVFSGSGSQAGSKIQKVRDPDLPKRPTNAYLIFCDMEKERIKQELEERNAGQGAELSKSLIEAWKNLDDEQRKPYYRLYEDDRERYQKEMTVYNQKKTNEVNQSTKPQKVEMNEGDSQSAIEEANARDSILSEPEVHTNTHAEAQLMSDMNESSVDD